MRLLVITADDYGYSDERDTGILECYRHEAISNVSLMVTGHSAERAVKRAQAESMPMGLHLNLTEGYPVVKGTYKTLTDKDDLFLGKMGTREAVQFGKISVDEVAAEIQAQIDKYTVLTGHPPVNVDGHQHIHVVPGVCEIFAKILSRNNIKWTRLPLETGIECHTWASDNQRSFMEQLSAHARAANVTFESFKIRTCGFAGLRTMGRSMTAERLQSCIMEGLDTYNHDKPANNSSDDKTGKDVCATQQPSTVVCELMSHPGYKTGSYGGCGKGPDAFSQSTEREHELEILRSQEMAEFYKNMKLKLISFENA